MSGRPYIGTQIFMSHSRKDEKLRLTFDSICAREGVASKCMEFEELSFPNQWLSIRDEIEKSFVLFLLLGKNVISSNYTRNWIAFEVGIACALNKDVWVFEEQGANLIEFPIPYLTDYMPYSIDSQEHYKYVRDVVGRLKQASIQPSIFLVSRTPWEKREEWRAKKNVPIGIVSECEKCGIHYSLHMRIEQFYCPSCRKLVSRRRSYAYD